MVVAASLVVLVLAGCLVVAARARRGGALARRGFVTVNAEHRAWLRGLRLAEPEDFLDREALIVSGHPGRQVARLDLGAGRVGYLKREQGVRWTTRLRNFLGGCGWVSRSVREAQVLEALERDGLPGPRWLATGEDSVGRAFLLVEEVPRSASLTVALRARPAAAQRRKLARHLGATLARLHEAGFFHRDLYAKHVLVGEADDALCLLDWQRAWRGAWVPRSARIRDLACLHATLPDDLAGPRERLACLRAYLGSSQGNSALRKLLAEVEALARRLRLRRHIREKRQPPTAVQQAWVRLDGEALCITPAFAQRMAERSLDWLRLDRQPLPAGSMQTRRWLTLPATKPEAQVRSSSAINQVLLVRQRQRVSLFRLCRARLLRKPTYSSHHRRATLLWRLERHGVAAPRVLAVGQRWQGALLDSFLLTEPFDGVAQLASWLGPDHPAERRADLCRQAGLLLARMHEACCYFEARPHALLAVRLDPSSGGPGVVLRDADGIQALRRPCPARARRDLDAFRQDLAPCAAGLADWWLHVEQGYASAQPEGAPLPGLEGYHMPPAPPRRERSSLLRRLRGCRRIYQRPDWAAFAGEDWAERIMQLGVTDDFHAKQGRSTGRLVLEAPDGRRLAVYLKRHYRLPFWQGWLATLWPGGAWSPAMKEYRHLEWAREQGVPVPASVAAGELVGPAGKLSSFLVVEELTGMLALHQAVPLAATRLAAEQFREWKRGLAAEMARLSRLLHDRRHFHKDLYLCHFFIHRDDTGRLPEGGRQAWRGRVVLIDLHRLTHHPWTWWWWLLKDLAQLLYSSEVPGVDARDQVAFWKHYRGPAARRTPSRWLRKLVVLRWRRYRSHNLRRKQKTRGQT
jgi:heptose I phosphotransferase